MDPLATELTSIGYHVHRVTLHGHNGESSQIFDERVWLHEVAQSYEEIRSRFPEIPTYVMGYSLGGLALMTMLDTVSPSNYPRGMILLAPAISLRGPLDVLTALHLPPPLPLAVPNLAPKEYRRYDETPLFWYSNTLSLYRKSESLKHIRSLAAIPTLVVLNNSDEIVSPGGTARWIKDHNLEHSWRIEIVKPESSKFSFKEHLIIDEASLGSTEWSRLRTLLANFL
jgi:esterase/lipase